MRRIAAPLIGGKVSTTALSLIVVPALYAFWRERQLKGSVGAIPAPRCAHRGSMRLTAALLLMFMIADYKGEAGPHGATGPGAIVHPKAETNKTRVSQECCEPNQRARGPVSEA